MGHIYAEVMFGGTKKEQNIKTLIDTGATYIVLPPEFAEEIGILKHPRLFRLRLANDEWIETEAGTVSVEVKERVVPATAVVVPGSGPLLGAEALEALGLKPNPQTGDLEPTRGYTIRA